MEYDKELLEKWCKMPDWKIHLQLNGGLTKYASKEGFNHLQQEFFRIVKQRIIYCEHLVKEHKNILVYYTLAQLYNRCDLNKSPDYLYKRQARYYCLEALKLDPNHLPTRRLSKKINEWVSFLGGEGSIMPHIEGSITNKDEKINFEW